MQHTFNQNDYDKGNEQKEFKPVPMGKYMVQVVECSDGVAGSGRSFFKYQLKILKDIEGNEQFKNRRLWFNLYEMDDPKQTNTLIGNVLKSCNIKATDISCTTFQNAVGCVEVSEHETFTRRDGTKGTKEVINMWKGWILPPTELVAEPAMETEDDDDAPF